MPSFPLLIPCPRPAEPEPNRRLAFNSQENRALCGRYLFAAGIESTKGNLARSGQDCSAKGLFSPAETSCRHDMGNATKRLGERRFDLQIGSTHLRRGAPPERAVSRGVGHGPLGLHNQSAIARQGFFGNLPDVSQNQTAYVGVSGPIRGSGLTGYH